MAHVAPGVFTKIIDLSEYVAGVPSTIGFLPIICEQGEDNKLIATNGKDFYIDFGEPNINYAGKDYGQGPYIASSFLKESDALYVIRCLPSDADYSNLVVYAEPGSQLGEDTTSDISASSVSAINTSGELDTLIGTDSTACVLFYGIGRGDYYNNYQIKIGKHSNPQLSDPETIGGYDLVYIVDIYIRQSEDDEEGQPQYEIIESYEVSFNPYRLDESGENMFIGEVINRYCRFIKCKYNELNCTRAIANQADFSQPFVSGPINLAEGDTGTLFDANGLDGDVATQILGKAYQGILPKTTTGQYVDEVLDTDNYYFTIVLDGGYPTDIKTSINTLVRTRLDCVALIDNGDNATVADAVSARVEDHTFNTRYMALYEPYNKIFDVYTGKDIWISPIYHLANIVPYTDNIAEVWTAPAGTNRATIAAIKDLRFSPRIGERDTFYLNQINPIVKFSMGNVVYSQLTTQKRPSALQDLNIVRCVLYIKRALEQFCKFYIFEYNDSATWSKISNEINAFLKVVQSSRGLYSYGLEVGANEYELKSKKIHVNVTLNPTRVIEQIHINFFIV
jgi:hypothetical protein